MGHPPQNPADKKNPIRIPCFALHTVDGCEDNHPITDGSVCMLYMVPFAMNIPQSCQHIYHTWIRHGLYPYFFPLYPILSDLLFFFPYVSLQPIR